MGKVLVDAEHTSYTKTKNYPLLTYNKSDFDFIATLEFSMVHEP